MKIKYSALVSDARGKLNGSVASKNRYGSYLRNKMTPVNRRTDFQQAVRSRFGAMSAKWNEITEAQRDAWRSYANDKPYTDIFGDQKTLQGNSMFTGVNTLLLNAQLPVLDAPDSSSVDLPYLGLSIDTLSVSEMSIELANTTTDADKIVVYATPPVSAGKKFLKNDYRIVDVLEITDFAQGEADIITAYALRFGTPIVGSRIGIGIVQVADNGQHSVMDTASEIVF